MLRKGALTSAIPHSTEGDPKLTVIDGHSPLAVF